MFKLSTSRANVAAGTCVNTSGSQSGTHTAHQPQARQTTLAVQDGQRHTAGIIDLPELGEHVRVDGTDDERLCERHALSLRRKTRAGWRKSDLAFRAATGQHQADGGTDDGR